MFPVTRPKHDPETSTEHGSFSNDSVIAYPHTDDLGTRGCMLEGPERELRELLEALADTMTDYHGPWHTPDRKVARAVVWHTSLKSTQEDLHTELRRASDLAAVDIVFC